MKAVVREEGYTVFENEVELAVEQLVEALHRVGAGEKIDAARRLREQADGLPVDHPDRDVLLAVVGAVSRFGQPTKGAHPWRKARAPKRGA